MNKSSSGYATAEAISRNNQLVLSLSWRIRKGIENGTESKRISAYTLHVYHNFLKEQFSQEENLYDCLAENNMLRIKACSEHAVLTPLFERMNKKIFSEAELQKLANILEKHARFETDTVLPHVKSLNYAPHRLPANVTQESAVENWADPFWKSLRLV